MRGLLLLGSLALLTSCANSGSPRADAASADATVGDAAPDGPPAACTDQQAAALITTYCAAGFHDGSGAACEPDVGQCESRGAYERTTAEQVGCLCYLCQVYQYAEDHMTCATKDTPPGYLLEQCLGGALRCP